MLIFWEIWRSNVPGEQNHRYFSEATKWFGDQMVKNDPGEQVSGGLMAGDQMAGELMS